MFHSQFPNKCDIRELHSSNFLYINLSVNSRFEKMSSEKYTHLVLTAYLHDSQLTFKMSLILPLCFAILLKLINLAVAKAAFGHNLLSLFQLKTIEMLVFDCFYEQG